MRSQTKFMIGLITIITLFSTWIALPTDWLDIGGFKEENGINVQEGLDLQGGLQVVLEARPAEGQEVGGDVLSGTRDTIERRVNALGVSEPLIQTRGDNQIVVELPGVEDPQAAVELLQATALLEIVDPRGQFLPVGTRVDTTLGPAVDPAEANASATPGEGTPEATPEPVPTETPAPASEAYTTIVSGADISDAFPTQDQFGTIVVGFELRDEASGAFCDFTSRNVSQPMSIVVDKTVINTATINQPLCQGSAIITGLATQEVTNLSAQLKSGALAVPLEVVQSRTVGPTLGQDSVDKSIIAGIVGLALVALLMILYYRLPGLLSVFSLLIYTAIVFALFKLIPVTLTLAGIAGFILSIGMAVDANVLIFARLKDELRLGRSVRNAVEAGFDHAWPSIRDSNMATMITCVILYWFGRYTGASIIQGFALTLFVGVVVSMFTAIVVTRTILRVLLNVLPIHNRWWLGVERSEIAGPPAAAGSTGD